MQKENNTQHEKSRTENNLRYDTLDKEFKTDMKEANKTLVELTTRSIVALEKSIEVSELVQQKMDLLVNNQVSIIHQTDKIR